LTRGGNYNLGITEQSIFPELTFEETQQVLHGMQITFVIKNEDKAHSAALCSKNSEFHLKKKEAANMAKKSMIARDEKRKKMIQKYAAKRAELKELGDQEGSAKASEEQQPNPLEEP
jgi:hypothetical protein